MSTRAHIVKKLNNGKYIGIYHHSDGYPEYLGELLLTYYDTEEKLDKLISLGDISFAGPIPEDDPKLWDRHIDFATGRPDYESDKCRTYKGRGESGCDARIGDLSDFIGEDFTYVFEDGKWTFYNWDEFMGDLAGEVAEINSIN